MRMEERIFDLKAQGLSCSQILMTVIGMDIGGAGGDELVDAMDGLSYGMHCQHTCGALTGAACALAVHRPPRETLRGWCKELSAWFVGRFESERCRDILGAGGPPAPVCTTIIRETAEKCAELLEEAGYL